MSQLVRNATAAGLGQIELNRPEAINALNLEMIRRVAETLERWRDDPEVRLVVLSGAGERGFCAGGDVRQVYFDLTDGHPDLALRFFDEEYALNAAIAEYPKPIVALIRGVCIGGGVGLAGHASIRVVFADARVAMPETRIGFTPDVGGSWLLGRAPGRLGEYLGLHGATMSAADAIAAGFADLYIAPAEEPQVEAALARAANSPHQDAVLAELASAPGTPTWAGREEEFNRLYSAATVTELLERLRREAPAQAAELEALSPMALEVTLRSIRAARASSLRDSLEREGRLVRWLLEHGHDTAEGIRALLVDKDKQPRWQPASVADLSPSDLPPDSLW